MEPRGQLPTAVEGTGGGWSSPDVFCLGVLPHSWSPHRGQQALLGAFCSVPTIFPSTQPGEGG